MRRIAFLLVGLCLTIPLIAKTAYSACGVLDDVCQDKVASPPSTLDPSMPAPHGSDTDTSALAPMARPDSASSIESKTGSQNGPQINHDDDLLAVPAKTKVVKDPFGPEVLQPMHVDVPQN